MLSEYAATLFLVALVYVLVKIVPPLFGIYKVNSEVSKVSGPKGHWLLGQTGIIRLDNGDGLKLLLKRIANNFPKMQRIIWLNPLIQRVVLYWPSALQTVYNSDCPKDEFGYDKIMGPWLGGGLAMSRFKKWQRNRRLLTPAFHFEILNNYVDIFNECSSVFLKKMEARKSVALFEHISLMTLDVILQTAMSSKTDCQIGGKENEYINAVCSLANLIMQRFSNGLYAFDFIYKRSSQGKEFAKAVDITHSYTSSIIKSRREQLKHSANQEKVKKKIRPDFIDMLLLAKDHNGVGMKDQEIRDEVNSFLFGGHDTTASGISWALYNLAVHKKHQDLCRKEINEILCGKEFVTSQDLPKFKYLTMCLKESMRTHPPVPVIGRSVVKNPLKFYGDFGKAQFDVNDNAPSDETSQTFPVGTTLEMNIFGLHHNPNVWSDPEKYDPSRFTECEIAKRSPYAYTPFAAGTRNCIGQNFAMMEMKITLAKILQKFYLSLDPSYPEPDLKPELILRAVDDIHILLSPVN